MSATSKAAAPPLRFHNPPLHRMGKVPASSLVELGIVLVAYVFALAAPSFVVSPGAASAPPGRLVLAVGLTLAAVAVALVTSLLAYRRTRNFSWLVIGGVPSVTLVMGAAILAGTKMG